VPKKLFKRIFRICVSPKVWGLPKRADVLFYDKTGSEKLIQFLFHDVKAEIIPTRNEEFSIPCEILAKLLIKYNQIEKISLGVLIYNAYVDSWIAFSRPSLIATFIDTDARFYMIKSRWKNSGIKTISFQNGARDITFELDILNFIQKNSLTKLGCDIITVLGSANIPIYSRHIDAKFVEYGSLVNNHTLQNYAHAKIPKRVIFISQYRDSLIDTDYYSSEKRLLPILSKWCARKGLELNILGCCHLKEEASQEEKFYKRIIIDAGGFKYLAKSFSLRSQYSQLDNSRLVVAVDSTLGLEALARRCRTIFYVDSTTDQPLPRLSIERDSLIRQNIAFFSDLYSEKDINSQLDSLINMPRKVWLEKLERLGNQVMALDECSRGMRAEISRIIERDIFTENHAQS